LSKILSDQKATVASLLANKNSNDIPVNYDMDTFRNQTASFELEVRELQEKNM